MAAKPENPSQAIDLMVPITAVHIALMVALAVLAVLTIVWGSILVRRRRNAEKQVQENFEVAEEHGATHAPTVSADGTEVATLSADVPEAPAGVRDTEAVPRDAVVADAPRNAMPAATPATAVPAAAPAPAPTPSAVTSSTTVPARQPATPATDGLMQIKGLGPKLAATLAEQGITRVDQIAALNPDEAATLDAKLGAFRGRMTRDRWIEQAKLLSAGDRAGYEAAFGKLGG